MADAAPTKIDQVLPEVWQQHVYYEFAMKDVKAALTTMSANPYVLMVPLESAQERARKSTSSTMKNFAPASYCISLLSGL